MEAPTVSRNSSALPAPNFCAAKMEKPWVIPVINPRIIQFSQSEAPRAARAWTPSTRPTMRVSITV